MSEKIAIYNGRLCPIHPGHEFVLNRMTQEFKGRCLLILGSSNSKLTLRNFFNYSERKIFAQKIYPDLPILGIPDYETDAERFDALDDLIKIFGSKFSDNFMNPEYMKENTIFFGGCEEDIYHFVEDERKFQIVNRFNSDSPRISATEVRDALIEKRDLTGLLNEIIKDEVVNLFNSKWARFKKI